MKAILLALLVLALGAGGVLAADPLGDDAGDGGTITLETDPAASTTTTTRANEDVPGPCDEPEHANDPRCGAGPGLSRETTTTETRRDDDAREPGEDVRGPCDEAEHANDPRCTGGIEDDDRRGPNRGPGGSDDSEGPRGSDDSRSGSNSGPG